MSINNILQHYERLQRLNPHVRYERDRITKAHSLDPSEVILGSDGFEGYMVFTFAHTLKVFLEKPEHGNAIYIIDDDWERLSRLTKRKLLTHPEATRIVHKGKWYWKVKQELEFDDA